MAIAKKINGFIAQSSFIRKMFEEGVRLKQKHGAENVFDFSLGNPNIDPPGRPSRQGCVSLFPPRSPGSTCTCRTPDIRRPERPLRAEVSSRGCALGRSDRDDLRRRRGAERHLEDDARPGEEVIIPAPFFVEYRFYVDNAGGETAVIIPPREDFFLDIEAIGEAITEKTKSGPDQLPEQPDGEGL